MEEVTHRIPGSGQILTFWVSKGDAKRFVFGKSLYIKNGYVFVSRQTYLHRIVAGARSGEVVDHVNRNRLDNRRENLRICTRAQNVWNSVWKPRILPRGVFLNHRRYMARIRVNSRIFYLGTFDTPEKAGVAYRNAQLTHHGCFVPFT